MVLFPPPFYFVFDISNLLSYIQNNFKLSAVMGTIFLVVKAEGCLGNYSANIPRTRANALGLKPMDSDCLQHNFLATVFA